MPYTITVGERCEVSDLVGVRCVLLAGHRNLHSRADGQRFSQPGGPLLFESGLFSGWATRGPMSASPSVPAFTSAQADDYVQSLTAKFRAEAFQRDLVTGQQLHDSCRAERRHTDTRADAHLRRIEALEQRATSLEKKVTSLEHDVAAAVSPGYVDGLAARVAKLEEQRRMGTAAVASWDADSAEPPRDGRYVDREDTVWTFESNRHGTGWVYSYTGLGDSGPFYSWAYLTSGHRSTADFPWKVKTDAEQ